jgi:enamine deaminase RidA (YjgF/YER057c/UK114 family)
LPAQRGDLRFAQEAELLDTTMTRKNISGSSPYEPIIGFSRAVRAGNAVHVSGTGPVGADEADAATQTRHVLTIIKDVLERAGGQP